MFSYINPGQMDTKISVRNPTVTRDSYGAQTDTYAHAGYVWGKILTVPDGYIERMNVLNFMENISLLTRYSSLIDERSILRINSVDYRVKSVRIRKRNDYMDILAETLKPL